MSDTSAKDGSKIPDMAVPADKAAEVKGGAKPLVFQGVDGESTTGGHKDPVQI